MISTHVSFKKVWAVIITMSVAAVGFLVWLLYLRQTPQEQTGHWVSILPLINCFFNATSTVCVCAGLWAIKRKRYITHGVCMIAAFLLSALFFITYSVYHALHGDTVFTGMGWVRPVYFFILISHILVTFVALPLILWTFFLAATRRWDKHRAWAKRTYPLWLYVSVTGVLIYVFLIS